MLFWDGMVENPYLTVGIIQISFLVTEIRPLPIYVRHIVFSDRLLSAIADNLFLSMGKPKHPYCVFEFLKYVMRCQKNLTNEM
jgi:hypothetical protein